MFSEAQAERERDGLRQGSRCWTVASQLLDCFIERHRPLRQCTAAQHNTTQHNTTQNSTTIPTQRNSPHLTSPHNKTQHNTKQHDNPDATQHTTFLQPTCCSMPLLPLAACSSRRATWHWRHSCWQTSPATRRCAPATRSSSSLAQPI